MGAIRKTMTALTDNGGIEKTLSSTDIFEGAILHVKLDEATLPNGKVAKREVVEHPGGVVALATLPNGKVLLVKQFRYPLGNFLYELPAGKLDPGETPLVSIQRELEEETGYLADKWEEILAIYTSPGFCNERITIFKATGLHPSSQARREEDEFIEVLEVSFNELRDMIQAKTLIDAKSICAIGLIYPEILK